MTVESTINKSGPYAGAGSVGPYLVEFRFLDQTHLQVIKTSTTGVDSDLVLTTDYSVSGVGNPTGSVTLVVPLATGEKLTIIRDVPFTQEADYVQNDAFPAESHEAALDKLTMEVQQLGENLDRTLTLTASTSPGVSTILPAPDSNKIIGWNNAADALENVDPATFATIVAYGTSASDIFSGTGAQTVFTLTNNPASVNNMDVAVGGVTQRPGIDYTWSSGTTMTFTTPPPLGTDNILVRYQLALPIGSSDAGSTTFDGSTVDEFFRNKNERVVNSIAALKALSRLTYTRAFVTGYYAAGDGGGGSYYYDPADVASADNGGTIIVAADGGRWKFTGGIPNVKTFGAKGDGTTNDSAAVQALAAVSDIVTFPAGIFVLNTTITLPQTRNISFKGAGYRITTIRASAVQPIFNYSRSSGVGGSVFEFTDIVFAYTGTIGAVGAYAIRSFGFSDAQSDNALKIRRCWFANFDNAINAKWTGQTTVEGCFFQAQNLDIACLRGCSLWDLHNVMSFSQRLLSVDDSIADAFTNGWTMRNVNSITAANTCIFMRNVQAIYMTQCGLDLGSGGTAAVWMVGCTDVSITDSYISSTGGATTRYGVNLDAVRRAHISSCSIVNNFVGVRLVGPVVLNYSTAVTVEDCWFDGQSSSGNDILSAGNVQGNKYFRNHHAKQLARTGTGFEIYGNIAGNNFNIIRDNTFTGASYLAAGMDAGANSIVADNLFGTLP